MKRPASDDPMELVGVQVAHGDLDYMAECVIDEYMRLGWTDRQIMLLFTQPQFRATYAVGRVRGLEYMQTLIARVRERWTPQLPAEGETDA